MRTCKINDCNERYMAKGYCNKHWQQMHTKGKILKHTRLDPNKIIIKDHEAFIVLCDNFGNEKAKTIIDIENVDKVRGYKWYLGSGGYVRSSINLKDKESLHRFILNTPDNKQVDHIDGNPLNNKRSNLRLCTPLQNMRNQKTPISNTSGFKGISWRKDTCKFGAYIGVNGKKKHLGYFQDIEDALKVRQEAEQEYFGEFNRIPKEEN
jgi:hypothetical protein